MSTIHDRARELAAQKQIPLASAYAELGRRGARKRNYGRVRVKPDQALGAVESPRFWWNREDA